MDPQSTSGMMLKRNKTFGDCFRVPLGFHMTVATADLTEISCVKSNTTFFNRPKSFIFTLCDAAPDNLFLLKGREHQLLQKDFQNTFNSNLLFSLHSPLANCILTCVDFLSKLCTNPQNQEQTSRSKSHNAPTACTRNGYVDLTRVLSAEPSQNNLII